MKKAITALSIIALLALITPLVLANTIRIDPYAPEYGEPTMLESPATFQVFVTEGGDPTYDPHIFLVMTEESFNGLTGDVTVEWGVAGIVTIEEDDWIMANEAPGAFEPPGVAPPAGYNVAALKSHLHTDGIIYWALAPFLDGATLTTTPIEFIVTLPSEDPRMMVYVLGKSSPTAELFNNQVPPSQPGFVVPEAATILLTASSMLALGAYAYKRKKQ